MVDRYMVNQDMHNSGENNAQYAAPYLNILRLTQIPARMWEWLRIFRFFIL